jgi:hypothetical protein
MPAPRAAPFAGRWPKSTTGGGFQPGSKVHNSNNINYLRMDTQMLLEAREYQEPVMKSIRTQMFLAGLSLIVLALMAGAVPVWAQDPPAPTGVWRHMGDAPQTQPATQKDPEPVARPDAQGGDPDPAPAATSPHGGQPYQLPAELTIRPGSFVTVRVNETISSDRSHPGDSFSGVLMQPLVVDGIVMAERGQAVYGRVAEAEKARSDAPSRLALELTELSLVDGVQTPVRSQMATRRGDRESKAEQANTIIGTTVWGAVIGSAVGWRTGAAIGAGAGAGAGAVAVMLTRNRPTVIYPETALTFRIDAPVVVSTARAPHAFRMVGPEDYNRPVQAELAPRAPARRPMGPVWGPMPYPYPPYGGPYYGPGVGVGIVFGRGAYGRWR